VASDQQQAAHLLCERLAAIGASSVALVRGPEHVSTHRIRAKVVHQHFKVVVDCEGPAQRETGRLAWSQQIAGRQIDAVVCTNNFLAIGVLEAMSGGSYLPPVAVFDGIPAMDLLPVPIVTCDQDVHRLAEGAVEMLLKRLKEPGAEVKPVIIPARLTCNPAFGKLSTRR